MGKLLLWGFARAGADIATASRKFPELKEVAEEIKGLGRKSLTIVTHAGRLDEINNLAIHVKAKFNRIDILVTMLLLTPL